MMILMINDINDSSNEIIINDDGDETMINIMINDKWLMTRMTMPMKLLSQWPNDNIKW